MGHIPGSDLRLYKRHLVEFLKELHFLIRRVCHTNLGIVNYGQKQAAVQTTKRHCLNKHFAEISSHSESKLNQATIQQANYVRNHPSQEIHFVVRVSGRRARTNNCSRKLEAGDIIAQSRSSSKCRESHKQPIRCLLRRG